MFLGGIDNSSKESSCLCLHRGGANTRRTWADGASALLLRLGEKNFSCVIVVGGGFPSGIYFSLLDSVQRYVVPITVRKGV